MKKVLSFTLAVALAFTLLLGSAFASSGVTVVAPDTFVSWGSAGDLTSLAVPSDAVADESKYIIYQVRDWFISYFRVRFVIDSFSRGDPVEGDTLSWTRYTGEWGLGVNAALEPASYEVEQHTAEEYTYSKNFLHLPVKSNFDYYDSNGELIISGSGYVNNFEGLMDLTLIDGTVIQVPRRLVGNQFVVVRSSSNSNQYKIWNFGTPDTLDGVYEGAEGVSYSTSVGSLLSGSSVIVIDGVSIDLADSGIDFSSYPYVACYWDFDNSYILLCLASDAPGYVYFSGSYTFYTAEDTSFSFKSLDVEDNIWRDNAGRAFRLNLSSSDVPIGFAANFDVFTSDDSLYFSKSFSFVGNGFTWSDWESSTAVLDLTSYGDIVYQTFDYPLSNPDDEPSESPEPDPSPDTGTSDGSNNGLFPWLKTQWVFLLQKLQNIVDAVKILAVDLDPYPDKTGPLLDDFFTNIFDNGVGEDDVVGLGGVLQNVRQWFNTDFKMGDLWDLFDEDYMSSWFTEETRSALDGTGGDLNN